jgi:glycosyltransferase involved in cell wall biosynthesis
LINSISLRVGWLPSRRYLEKRSALFNYFGFYRRVYHEVPVMRVLNIAKWINRRVINIRNELYNPSTIYNIVVVVKLSHPHIESEMMRVNDYGGKIIYDANVNYWEVWGNFDERNSKPTLFQQQSAIAITKLADCIVASSSYLAGIACKYHPRVECIPDNVNLSIYSKIRKHKRQSRLRIVWSGMSFKAEHLTLISPVLEELSDQVELVLVSEKRPSVMDRLPQRLKMHYVPFSDRRYSKLLGQCDVIISPKRLLNSYDLGHSEYKITLGMAAGLPAVASPQQSYMEAISYLQGGIIAKTLDDWHNALKTLNQDLELRSEMGRLARRTVVEKYSTPILARRYADVLDQLAN